MVEQLDVGFGVDGNVTLCGWLFVPDGRGPRPAITMAHGYAGIREHGLDRFARVFADAGFVVPIKPGACFRSPSSSPPPVTLTRRARTAISASRHRVPRTRQTLSSTLYAPTVSLLVQPIPHS